jgi:hypothetical protein
MVGSLGIAIALVIVGLIAAVVVPGAGLVIGIILVVVGVLLAVGGFAAGKRRAPAAPR